jgi:hypothetical protein
MSAVYYYTGSILLQSQWTGSVVALISSKVT